MELKWRKRETKKLTYWQSSNPRIQIRKHPKLMRPFQVYVTLHGRSGMWAESYTLTAAKEEAQRIQHQFSEI